MIGAGGHAAVIADAVSRPHKLASAAVLVGLLDDDHKLAGSHVIGLPVLGTVADLDGVPHDAVIVAIGNNRIRRDVYDRLVRKGERFVRVVHRSVVIGGDVHLSAANVMICAGAIVNPGTTIGANVILNTACSVDHHNRVGDHAHVAPGVHLGGYVTVGEGAFIGIGAAVVPGVRIGAWSTVGSNAAVVRDVDDGITAVGVPARPR
jgi:sugar O-acyltransferase (sialic acid O-acetyltransferase NeuD family)